MANAENSSVRGINRIVPVLVAVAAAALVGWLYIGGEVIEVAISGKAGREAIIAAIWGHVGRGVATAPLIIAYVAWRLMSDKSSFAQSAMLARAAKIALWALCAVLVFLVVTGPIVVWTNGSDMKVFDWFVIPTFMEKVSAIHDPLESAHGVVAGITPWVVAVDFLLLVAVSLRRRSA